VVAQLSQLSGKHWWLKLGRDPEVNSQQLYWIFVSLSKLHLVRTIWLKMLASLHSAGRLEIFLHGVWMTVCGEMFTDQAANVACRQLGFDHAAEHCTNAW